MKSNSTPNGISPTMCFNKLIPSHSFCTKISFKLLTVLFVFLMALSCSEMNAQTPIVTKNVTMPTGSANSRGVAYGNGYYVTVLYSGDIYRSLDGELWARSTGANIPIGNFNGISFGAGVFVIVGQSGSIYTSSDGLTWTSRTSTTTNHLYAIQYLQSNFYAVGHNKTVRKSIDGITWTTIGFNTGGTNDMFMQITYGNGVFVLTARASTGSGAFSYRSTTGNTNTWTFQDHGFNTLNRIQYLGNRFYQFNAGNQMLTSTDALTWTNITSSIVMTLPNNTTTSWTSSNQIFNGFHDGTRYYFFGSTQYHSGYGSVITSTDGINFTLHPKSAYIVPQNSAYINGKYFQTGNEGIVSSNNGTVYKYPSGSYSAIASSGNGYVAVGYVSTAGVIFSSNDFNVFTERTPPGTRDLYGVVYNGSKYVAVGNQTVVESTDNGVTWTQIATPTQTFYSIEWGNNRFVSVGYDAGNAVISYSNNGISWTNAHTSLNNYTKVKYVNGEFFALGYDQNYLGVIMRSTDGITWTNITPNLPFPVYYFNDVVYDGTKYHFMGMEYINPATWAMDDFFSVSTSTVTNPNSFSNKGTIGNAPLGSNLGGDWGQGAFVYSNGMFIGMVNDITNNYEAYVIYSSNGIDWTSMPINETTNIFGAMVQGNIARFVGTGDGKVSVDFSGLLAVHLLEFNARAIKTGTQLFWKTATEQNSLEFIVQHSLDGRNWSHIGKVAAQGNSNSITHYNFLHTDPANGINHYRLLEVETDGSFNNSKIETVQFKTSIVPITAYPNPVTNGHLQINMEKGGQVQIFNAAGALVLNQQCNAGRQNLSVTNLSKGVYTLKALEQSIPIIIQ